MDEQGGGQKKFIALIVTVAVVSTAIFVFRDSLSLTSMAEKETQLREFQAASPVLVFGAAFAVYALAAGFSIPGATALTLMFGWYFGWFPGVLVVSFASTAGATMAFLLSRYFFSDWVQQRFGTRLDAFNERLKKEGAFYLFTLRLIPAFPFFVINLVMGLTPIRTTTYWWVSQLGMFPATVIYVYAGSRVPNLTVLANDGVAAVISPTLLFQVTLAFALLGVFPLVVKRLMNRATTRLDQEDKQAA